MKPRRSSLLCNHSVRLMMAVAVTGLCSGLFAQTYDAFKAAIEAAQDGDTVYLENDLEFNSALPPIAGRITIASPAGHTNVLRRAKSFGSSQNWLFLTNSTADVTLRDVIIDGSAELGTSTLKLFRVKAGRLTLDAGTTVRNFSWTNHGICVYLDGTAVMNEGAVIRDCTYTVWGMFLVGRLDGAEDKGGTFYMNGGLITGCAGIGTTAEAGYDGVLYIYYGGKIYMSGGTITGNTSVNATAGVIVYNDATHPGDGLHLSGTATIVGNTGGKANDIWIYPSSGRLYVAPDYAGRATLWNGSTTTLNEPAVGSEIARVSRDNGSCSFFSGAGRISCQGYPGIIANGYYEAASDKLLWGRSKFRAGDVPYATWREAWDSTQDGDTIYVESDIVDEALTINASGRRTFTSGEGEKRSIRLTSGVNFSTVLSLGNGADVRLENVIVDGGKDVREGNAAKSIFNVETNCVLTLGAGTVVRNIRTSNQPAVAALAADRAKLIMEDGALITGCEDVSTAAWGFLIRAGQLSVNATGDDRPLFEMRGGCITGNTAATTSAASGGYGGMIYVQKGRFVMSGGSITGNSCGTSSAGSNSGVQSYSGETWISGTARIENNPGKNPDLYRSGGTIHFAGDFRGHVGISSGNQGSGQAADITVDDGATGAWGFFPAANSAAAGLVGTLSAGSVRWTASTGSIDGDGIVTAADALECWNARNTLALDDAGIAALPHVFAGTALGIDGSLTLSFDPEAMRDDPRLPIRLVSAQDGALTGSWTFNLPTFDRRGSWEVVPVRSGTDVIGYDLAFFKAGMMLIFR